FYLYYITIKKPQLKNDEVIIKVGEEKPVVEMERKKSIISDTISIKSVLLTLNGQDISSILNNNDNDNTSPPIVICPPTLNDKHLLPPPTSLPQLLENNP